MLILVICKFDEDLAKRNNDKKKLYLKPVKVLQMQIHLKHSMFLINSIALRHFPTL